MIINKIYYDYFFTNSVVLIPGVAVPSVLVVQAGQTLHQVASESTWSWSSVLLLATFAALSLLPVLFKAKLRDKFD